MNLSFGIKKSVKSQGQEHPRLLRDVPGRGHHLLLLLEQQEAAAVPRAKWPGQVDCPLSYTRSFLVVFR